MQLHTFTAQCQLKPHRHTHLELVCVLLEAFLKIRELTVRLEGTQTCSRGLLAETARRIDLLSAQQVLALRQTGANPGKVNPAAAAKPP